MFKLLKQIAELQKEFKVHLRINEVYDGHHDIMCLSFVDAFDNPIKLEESHRFLEIYDNGNVVNNVSPSDFCKIREKLSELGLSRKDHMTVEQLRDFLDNLIIENPDNGELVVATSMDPEGNGYHVLPPLDKFGLDRHGVEILSEYNGQRKCLVLFAWEGIDL